MNIFEIKFQNQLKMPGKKVDQRTSRLCVRIEKAQQLDLEIKTQLANIDSEL
jgi:hypothetical protein